MDKKKKSAIFIGAAVIVLFIIVIAVAANSEDEHSKASPTTDNAIKANVTETVTDMVTTADENIATNKTYGGNGNGYANDIFTNEAEENVSGNKKNKSDKSNQDTTKKSENETTKKSNNDSKNKNDENNPNNDKGWSDLY